MIPLKNKDQSNKDVALKKRRTSQGYLQVFYTPELIGSYYIFITKNGQPVMRSPIMVHSFDPNKVKVEDIKLESDLNQKYEFKIDASQAGQGFIRVAIKGKLFN